MIDSGQFTDDIFKTRLRVDDERSKNAVETQENNKERTVVLVFEIERRFVLFYFSFSEGYISYFPSSGVSHQGFEITVASDRKLLLCQKIQKILKFLYFVFNSKRPHISLNTTICFYASLLVIFLRTKARRKREFPDRRFYFSMIEISSKNWGLNFYSKARSKSSKSKLEPFF